MVEYLEEFETCLKYLHARSGVLNKSHSISTAFHEVSYAEGSTWNALKHNMFGMFF